MNYKGTVRRIIFAGVENSVPASANLVAFHEPTVGATVADAMFDTKTNLVYSVPAGKTLRILGIRIHTKTVNAGAVVVSSGDIEDAETATIISIILDANADVVTDYYCDVTFASGKFITINPSQDSVEFIQMIGYEL